MKKVLFVIAVVIVLSVSVMADGGPCKLQCGNVCCHL